MGSINPPCGDCEKKGCGPYHDVCPKYQAYKDQLEIAREVKKAHEKKRPVNPYLERRIKERGKGKYR